MVPFDEEEVDLFFTRMWNGQNDRRMYLLKHEQKEEEKKTENDRNPPTVLYIKYLIWRQINEQELVHTTPKHIRYQNP